MKIDPEVAGILEEALRSKSRWQLRLTMSSEAIRVAKLEKYQSKVPSHAMGEHPHTQGALRLLAEDHQTGGRLFKGVSPTIERLPYFAGASKPDDELDTWVRNGGYFLAYLDPEGKTSDIIFELRGLQTYEVPQAIIDRVFLGHKVSWKDARGVTFEGSPITLADGTLGCSVRTTKQPFSVPEPLVWNWRSVRKGRGAALQEALDRSLAAPYELYEDLPSCYDEELSKIRKAEVDGIRPPEEDDDNDHPPSPLVLHLKTQRGQPPGTERRNCEECGLVIWMPPVPVWTEDPAIYAKPPPGYLNCKEVARREKNRLPPIPGATNSDLGGVETNDV